MDLTDVELSLLIVNDSKIAKLNKQWRKQNKATDVLSFPQNSESFSFTDATSDMSPALLGDIVISGETAERQAKENGLSLEQEFKRLLIHGILHCLGYDHESSKRGAQEMHKLEKKLEQLFY